MISSVWWFLMSLALFVAIVYGWNIFIEQGKYIAIKKYLLVLLCIVSSFEVCYMSTIFRYVTMYFPRSMHMLQVPRETTS